MEPRKRPAAAGSTSRSAALLALLAALIAGSGVLAAATGARGAEPDEPLLLIATMHGGLGQTGTTIRIEDGTATITPRPRDDRTAVIVRLDLTDAEQEELRGRIAAARFFEEWERAILPCDAPEWDVSVRLGDRERARTKIPSTSQVEFQPLETFLNRLVAQGRFTVELRQGVWRRAVSAMRHPPADRVLRWSALAPDVLDAAAGAEDARACGKVAGALVRVVFPEEWKRFAEAFLPRLDPGWRAELLTAWHAEIETAALQGYDPAFYALGLAEVERWWASAPTATDPARWPMVRLVAALLGESDGRAFAIAEGMARAWSTPEAPFVPAGLVEHGAAAVPSAIRLLEHDDPSARSAGAQLARRLTEASLGRGSVGQALSDEDRAALRGRLSSDVAPHLRRLTQDAAEPFAVRTLCWRALDQLEGRDRAAERRAAARAERAARPKPTPTPRDPGPVQGALAIAGRVLTSDGLGAEGVGVVARRSDGALGTGRTTTGPDGAFHIEGLAAGPHRVQVAHARRRLAPPPESVREGVEAGASGVVLSLGGSLLRGRLLDPNGAPAPDRRVVARMRDGPSELHAPYPRDSGVTKTDADGRFLFLHVFPGTYDLEVVGHEALEGGHGIAAGPTDHRVQMVEGATISGRVVDETGAPFSSVRISASPVGKPGQCPAAELEDDGTFSVKGLDPALRYTISAHLMHGAPPYRGTSVSDLAANASDVVVRMDTSPWVRVRVRAEAGGRRALGIQLRRIAGGKPCELRFTEAEVHLPAAPGTWRVQARVREVDAKGEPIWIWVDVGTVEGGEPERTFVVPP